jgi:hypothetical protein
MDLQTAADTIARALDRLGNADAATPMGAIEGMAAHLGEKIDRLSGEIACVATALHDIADAIRATKA